jgi:hypothetical protein
VHLGAVSNGSGQADALSPDKDAVRAPEVFDGQSVPDEGKPRVHGIDELGVDAQMTAGITSDEVNSCGNGINKATFRSDPNLNFDLKP